MEWLRKIFYKDLPFLISLPAYLWEVFFLFIPLIVIFTYSLIPDIVAPRFLTLSHYWELFTTTYAKIVFNSCVLAFITAGLCLLIAFPVAYFLAVKAPRKFKNILLIALILPSWTSFIIQIYSWFYLLQKHGVFSSLIYHMGWTSQPTSLLNCYGATVLGMVYCFLPFMILPLYTVLERMDKKVLEASADLGANRWQTFRHIIFPLTSSGINVGLLLVMIPAFGEFAIPDLMGGFKGVYVGRTIMEKFLIYRNWHSGAAVVMLSIIFPLLLLGAMHVLQRFWRRFRVKVS